MYKACARCGKMHPKNYYCTKGREYHGGTERKLRSLWAWTKKSEEIREKANYLCEVCKTEGIYTYKGLEVHHIVKVKDDHGLLLDNSNLICLCEFHHKLAEKGDLGTDYLKSLAEMREQDATRHDLSQTV